MEIGHELISHFTIRFSSYKTTIIFIIILVHFEVDSNEYSLTVRKNKE